MSVGRWEMKQRAVKRCLGAAGVTFALLILSWASLASARQEASPVSGCPPTAGTPLARPDQMATPVASPAIVDHAAVGDDDRFIAALEACGLTVELVGPIEQPFLRAGNAIQIRVRGGGLAQPADIQVFSYADPAMAAADAAQIGPDGNPRTMIIEWIAPPHFFRAERLIVLYVGYDQAVIDLLTALLGPPFAG